MGIANQSSSSLKAADQTVVLLIFGLAAGPAWLKQGIPGVPLPVFLLLAVATLATLAWFSRPRGSSPGGNYINLRDPVFWSGLVFLALLLVQWWNSGRVLYFDARTDLWRYSEPRHAGLPFAVTPGEAKQMLEWFFPAWVILLPLRARGLGSRAVRQLWRLLAYHAGLLALYGIVKFSTSAATAAHSFAPFGYPNHAGSYFLMTLCLAVGLLSYYHRPEAGRLPWLRPAVLGLVFFLSLLAANMSLSRAAIILSWLVVLPLSIHLVRFFWPQTSAAQRVNMIAAGAAILALAVLLTVGLGYDAIRREFEVKPQQKSFLARETSFRWFQVESALKMWKDHPLYGVGGWGYRYLMASYIPKEQWKQIGEGKANVHNDPLQFLTEFGLLGAGAMAVIVLALLVSALRAEAGRPPIILFPLIGTGLVGLQSLIDLPFRSPAILYLWLILLAGCSRVLSSRRNQGKPELSMQSQLNVPSR